MNPEQPDIDEILLVALEMAPGPRGRYLSSICQGDFELRRELDSLIDVDSKAAGFLEPVALPKSVTNLSSDIIGQELGAYRIREVLGVGGMGTVYLADRSDELFQKQVAIKVVRHGLDTEAMLEKFGNERRVLASLEHPHIARLVDAGVTPDGSPFLVMEYVNGVELLEYCREKSPSIRERLEIFQTICSAVHYAHRNLVIHRDLKPSNILVTRNGQVKLLDFGISKVLDPMAIADDTRTGARMLTPRYASPEQVRNQPMTTVSDVYSLGLILYELLAGRHPYPSKEMTPSELERVVCDTIPTRPSEAVLVEDENLLARTHSRQRRLARELAGDLDNVVLKAISKEPERRYASPGQMSEDIQKYLDGLPIGARPDTLRYRTGKFVVRNRIAVAAITVLIVALGLGAFVNAAAVGIVSALFLVVGVGALGSTWLYFRASSAKSRADRAQLAAETALGEAEIQRRTAEAVSTFLRGMLSEANPTTTQRREDRTIGQIMADAGERIERDLGDEPEVASALFLTIGQAQHQLANFSLAEQNLRSALRFRFEANEIPGTETAIILLNLGRVLHLGGKAEEAELILRRTVAIFDSLATDEVQGRSRARQYLCEALTEKGKFKEAESQARVAISIRRSHRNADSGDLAGDLTALGLTLIQDGRVAEADPYLREALALSIAERGENHSSAGRARANVGWALTQLGKHKEAIPELERALEIHKGVYADEHPNVVAPLSNLADCYQKVGRLHDAINLLARVEVANRRQYRTSHPLLGHAIHNLGYAIMESGDHERGDRLLEEAADTYASSLGDEHAFVAVALNNRAAAMQKRGEFSTAEPLAIRALEIRRKALRKSHPDIARSTELVAELWMEQGKYAAAGALFDETLDIRREELGRFHPFAIRSHQNLADLRIRERRLEDAEVELQHAKDGLVGKGPLPSLEARQHLLTDELGRQFSSR